MISYPNTTVKIRKTAAGASVPSPSVVENRQCTGCSHFTVCALFRAFAKFLSGEFTYNTEPMKDMDLAKICKAYLNTASAESLST